ncbi:MAG: ATP synthase subunit I [Rhodoferax sp.]|uniref:ATP synthase subunit I n=1 Tax=Rhodoferax sp. TaxID=50421 RepID=UPI0017BBAFA7|nr:ATP synthase subunit I [Rhodoferax sp.]NMM14640.1 ATP synthase subunit I [Rhodoferax sp.]NMM18414.1 ATP synthase subunit I [Rhodoferax sp.]
MSIITPDSRYDSDESEELEFKRLTAEEAQALRELHPSVSPWLIVGMQVLVGLLVALAAWGFTGKSSAGWSAAYGALAVIVPAVVFARGLTSQFSSLNAATAWLGFFVWEAIKIAVSVGMLFAAPRLVVDLDWLVMLIGLIVTMKVYWVALLMRPKRKTK